MCVFILYVEHINSPKFKDKDGCRYLIPSSTCVCIESWSTAVQDEEYYLDICFVLCADLQGGCSGLRQREQDPLHGGFSQEPLQCRWSLLGASADYQVHSLFIWLAVQHVFLLILAALTWKDLELGFSITSWAGPKFFQQLVPKHGYTLHFVTYLQLVLNFLANSFLFRPFIHTLVSIWHINSALHQGEKFGMINSSPPVPLFLHPQTVSGDGESSSYSSSHRETVTWWLSLCPPLSTVTMDTKASSLYSKSKKECVCVWEREVCWGGGLY